MDTDKEKKYTLTKNLVDTVAKASKAARGQKGKAPAYPIVKIDRTTTLSLLPIFMDKAIFSNYMTLKSKEDILQKEKEKLNKDSLTFPEERVALQKAKEYKDGSFVIRDYGVYAIGFSAKLYIDYIEKTEDELKDELRTPTLFPEMNKNIEEALKKIRLYKIAHKLAFIILSEVYTQKKYKGLVITKQRIIKYLGYTPEEKHIYNDIKEALTSLRWLNYIFFDYTFTKTNRTRAKGKAVGNFIYNLKEDNKAFTFDINEVFVGCVQFLFAENRLSRKDRKTLFKRGYGRYITRGLPLSRGYSIPAYLLSQFLLMERGNRRLREKGYKVIAYKVERYMKEAGIQIGRPDRQYNILLSALQEIDIIDRIEPGIEELKKVRPSERLKYIVKVWITHPAESLDRQIELKTEGKNE